MTTDTASSIRSLANALNVFPALNFGNAVEEIATESEQLPMIAVIGEFNAGKSTLLNALIGEKLLSMDVLPATDAVTLLKFGPERQATLQKCDGSSSRIDLERLGDYTSQTGALGARQRASIKEVEVALPCALLSSATLVDTPGFNSPDRAHRQATERFVKRADALIWVFSATQAGSHSQLNQIEELKTGMKPFAVINRIDELDEDVSVDEFIRERTRSLATQTENLVGASARLALAATSNGDKDLLETSRLAGLKQFLCDDVLESANRNKRSREAAKLLCVIRQIRTSFEQRYTELSRAREAALRAVQILADTSAYIGAWSDFRWEWSAPLDRLINSGHSLPAMPRTPNEPNIPPDVAAKWQKLVSLRNNLTEIIAVARPFSDDSQPMEKDRVRLAEEILTFNKSCLFGRPLFDSAQRRDLAQRRKSWLENALQFKAKVLGDLRRAEPLMFSPDIETLQKYLLNFADERIATYRANSQAAQRQKKEGTADWLALSWSSDAAAQISAILPKLEVDLLRSGADHEAHKEIQALRRHMGYMTLVVDFPKDIQRDGSERLFESDATAQPALSSRIEELRSWRNKVALLNPTLPEISTPLFQRLRSKIARNNVPIRLRTWAFVWISGVFALWFYFSFIESHREPAPESTMSDTSEKNHAPTLGGVGQTVVPAAPATSPTSGPEAALLQSVNPENQDVSIGPLQMPAISQIQKGIKAALGVWTQTMLASDLDGQMECYAPVVEAFFGASNLDSQMLRSMKAVSFEKYPLVTRYDITGLHFRELTRDRVTVSFQKEWMASGKEQFSGAAQEVLTFALIDERWRIVAEREPEIYWVDRTKAAAVQ